MFSGVVVCEGEGHLNARSCLLEGVGGSVRQKGVCVRMVVPDNVQCSLFPGQVSVCGVRSGGVWCVRRGCVCEVVVCV